MNRRALATAVLAAGAFASIATSPATWDIITTEPLPDTVLDEAQPLAGYRIRAELSGPIEETEGWLDLELRGLVPATGDGPESATATVTLTRDSEPDAPITGEVRAGPGEPVFSTADLLWSDCAETPCVETFTLWIDRGEVTAPARPLTISGTITAQLDGIGNDAPSSVDVTVEITPLEVAP